MGKIKGWKKWENGWVSKNGLVITMTQRQDRDGRNAFLYGATIYNRNSLGTGRNKKILFKEIRNLELLKKKVINYMRSHSNG